MGHGTRYPAGTAGARFMSLGQGMELNPAETAGARVMTTGAQYKMVGSGVKRFGWGCDVFG